MDDGVQALRELADAIESDRKVFAQAVELMRKLVAAKELHQIDAAVDGIKRFIADFDGEGNTTL